MVTQAPPPPGAVLVLIDLQKAIDHPDQGTRNNPTAEKKIAKLLNHWRRHHWPVWHIRHDSVDPTSHYRPGQPGHDFKPETAPLCTETVIGKTTNDAFVGTDLAARFVSGGHSALVVAGVTTNISVEGTVRTSGNLGFATYLVADACFTFGRCDAHGTPRSADEVHAMTLANLDGDFCAVTTTEDVLGWK